jgi:2-polyprenyl-3-methyl-5-hydroxy-6-metoxy-1,4-benzoquinol methylase
MQPFADQVYRYNLDNVRDQWKEKYNVIKDVSWPSCDSFEEFENLPTKIKNECIEIHNFSPEIWKKHLIEDSIKPFSLEIADHVKDIMISFSDSIVGQDIVDFACNTGNYSFACWKAGANSVVGFDVRQEHIIIANAIKNYYGIDDSKVQFKLADVHDYDGVLELCKNKSTALIPGLLYHVHDHYEILKTVSQTDIKNIIIETGENKNIMNSSEPLIWWRTEHTLDNISGWHNHDLKIPVGYPNLSWFKMIMSNLNYNWVSTTVRTGSVSKNSPEEFKQHRSIHVFQR